MGPFQTETIVDRKFKLKVYWMNSLCSSIYSLQLYILSNLNTFGNILKRLGFLIQYINTKLELIVLIRPV